MTELSHEGEHTELNTNEISEILRAFAASEWSGMRLRVGEVTLAVGRDAEPPPAIGTPAAGTPAAERSTATLAPVAPAISPAAAAAPKIAPQSAAAGPEPEVIDETGLVAITSPTVGAFWVAPDPGSPPFVSVGSRVAEGDQLAIIEVMKLMNPVVSSISGEVAAIKVANAEMVEFGQALFLIRPDE